MNIPLRERDLDTILPESLVYGEVDVTHQVQAFLDITYEKAQFEIQRREAEHSVKAELVTAYPASESQKDAVIAALKKRLERDIELECTTDSRLLGGAIIRAGDLVIDGTVLGKLQRLGNALTH